MTDQELYHAAQSYTNGLYHQKDNHDTHDIGFILYCSYGNGIRLVNSTSTRNHEINPSKNKEVDGGKNKEVDDGKNKEVDNDGVDSEYGTYVQVLLDGAQSLASRFNPTVGCIQVDI